MSHLDEATILSLRDGSVLDAGTEIHLDECTTCLRRVAAAQRRSAVIAEALSALDMSVDVAAAKAATRERLDRLPGRRPRPAWRSRHFIRAAAVLLLTAGAVAALQWPSLRLWRRGVISAPEVPEALEAAGAGDAARSGISVDVPDGRIQVVVRGAALGTTIDVGWIRDTTGSISAPARSRFTYTEGRAVVDVEPGAILVELPREARLASLEVDGRLYVMRARDRVEVSGPVTERSEDRIRFVVGGP